MTESSPTSAPVHEGDVLDGKYKVERVLGEGGMGVVVAATHLHLQERVALKFLLLEVSRHTESVTRFLREAQAAVKIKSEHVARVSDVGTLDSGAPYMVMEYLEGHDLEAVLQREGPLAPATAVDYVLQACEAVAAAHQLGIVHRDLKPANLFLTYRTDGSPCIKVLDFGISKMTAGDNAKITKTIGAMGTPAYMSPEQLRSARDVDARTDIWALGAILYELLTNALPFDGGSVAELCAAVLTDPVRHLRDRAPDVPAELEAVVLRCLKKDPEDRYATVAELAAAVEPFGSEIMRGTAARLARSARKPAGETAQAWPPRDSGVAHAPTESAPVRVSKITPSRVTPARATPARATPAPAIAQNADSASIAEHDAGEFERGPRSGCEQPGEGSPKGDGTLESELHVESAEPFEAHVPVRRRGAWLAFAALVLAGGAAALAFVATSGPGAPASPSAGAASGASGVPGPPISADARAPASAALRPSLQPTAETEGAPPASAPSSSPSAGTPAGASATEPASSVAVRPKLPPQATAPKGTTTTEEQYGGRK